MHYDNFGLIVQSDGNAGDTCEREGWAWFGIWIREHVLGMPSGIELPLSFEETVKLLEIDKSGNFRRHPTMSPWNDPWHEPGIFTRDQQTPLIAAMGVWGLQEPLQRMWDNLTPSNLGLGLKVIQGFDIAGWDHLNLFRRARNEQPDDTGDQQLGAAVALRFTTLLLDDAFNRKPIMNEADDLSLIINLLMAKLKSPSEKSEAAIVAYSKNRPITYGCYLGHYRQAYPGDFAADLGTMTSRIREGMASGWSTDCPRVLGALRWYFRPESHNNPELAELYAPIVEKFMT